MNNATSAVNRVLERQADAVSQQKGSPSLETSKKETTTNTKQRTVECTPKKGEQPARLTWTHLL